MLNDIEKVLFDEKQLAAIVKRLGDEISADYKDKDLVLVGVLKGAAPFVVDLMRQITLPVRLEFIRAASYGSGMASSGNVVLSAPESLNLADKDVLVVEDILDSGHTLSRICGALATQNLKSLAVCTLFDKPDRREMPVAVRYAGQVVPDLFIVGYGLDYNETYRNLPFVGVLKPAVYKS